MKLRTKPEPIPTRSKLALEALSLSIARRLPGLQRVRRVEVVETAADPEGINWRIGKTDPALSAADYRRIQEALEAWRRRFQLA